MSKNERAKNDAQPQGSGWRRDVLAPLLALHSHVATDAPQFGNKEVRPLGRDLECFRDPITFDMGPYLRCLAMFRLVCERLDIGAEDALGRWKRLPSYDRTGWPTLKEVAETLLERVGELRTKRQTDWLRPLLSYDEERDYMMPAKHYTDQTPQVVALAACVNDIRALHHRSPTSASEILRHPVIRRGDRLGDADVERFAVWLESGVDPARENVTHLSCEHYELGTERSLRQSHLSGVLDWLGQPDECFAQDGASPEAYAGVINIWAESAWHGLRAFATSLVFGLKEQQAGLARADRYNIIYFPLRQLTWDQVEDRATRRRVLEFLFRQLETLADRRDLDWATDSVLIEAIQRRLTTSKTLVILDGVEQSSGPFAALFNALRETDWQPLIRSIVQVDEQQMLQQSGRYMSRLVLLSNSPLLKLRGWMPRDPQQLPSIEDRQLAVRLLQEDESQRDARLRATIAAYWPANSPGPRVDRQGHLRLAYSLSAGTVAALLARGNAEVPSELELSIAVCADHSRQQWLSQWPTHESRNAFFVAVLGKYLEVGDVGRSISVDMLPRGAALLALEVLAVAGRALSERMLFTAMEACVRFSASDSEMHVTQADVDTVRQRGAADIQDEWAPLLRLSVVPFTGNVGSDGAGSSPDRVHLAFKLDEVRELTLSSLLRTDVGKSRFRYINRALSEQALLQGTALVRDLPLHRVAGIESLLPFLRAVFHGLMSLNPAALDPRGHDKDSVRNIVTVDSALPEDNYRRYAFLYQHLYRRVIENAPTWIMGRGFERDDIRLSILAVFANPGWARAVLRDMPESPVSNRTFSRFSAFGRVKDAKHKSPFEPEERQLFGAVGADMLSALYHAALRSAQDRKEVQAAAGIAARIRHDETSTPHQKPGEALANWRLGFDKITIDALQSEPNSKEAERRCSTILHSLGVELSADELRKCGALLPAARWHKLDFESSVRKAFLEPLLELKLSKTAMEQVSDLLFRLGESMATEADFNEDRTSEEARERSVLRYAAAYAAYWIGDRVRSSSATSDSRSVDWPAVSARASRYFVRTSLKLSKHLAYRASISEIGLERDNLSDSAAAFHVYAMTRIDVYTRHLYRLPAERVQAVLLLAAAARIESSMRQYLKHGSGWERDVDQALERSRQHLEQARKHLLECDFVVPLLNRFLLERLKTAQRIAFWTAASQGEMLAGNHIKLAWHDLSVLRRLSLRSTYYRRILDRLSVSRARI